MDSIKLPACHGRTTSPGLQNSHSFVFFWCVVLFSLWYVFFCWVYFPKSLQRLNSRDQFFLSIRGLVMVFLGEFTLMNPPKVMGVFRASKGGWTHKIFLMVSYGFSQALFFFHTVDSCHGNTDFEKGKFAKFGWRWMINGPVRLETLTFLEVLYS